MMANLRENVWNQRHLFTFDHHADTLIQFFKAVIHKEDSQKKKDKEAKASVLPFVTKLKSDNITL
jgi:hypothetical protein